MKNFYIIANEDKQNTSWTVKRMVEYLSLKGASCKVHESREEEEGRRPEAGFKYTDPADVPARTECVITLGGDGTLIQAARDLAGLDIPILGINLGTLGYLTQGDQAGRAGDLGDPADGPLHPGEAADVKGQDGERG